MPIRSKLKIFLADDSAARLEGHKRQLEGLGYAVVFSFASPDACLRRLPLRPDLVLLPCPVKSPEGIRLAQRIHAYNRRTMVLYAGAGVEAAMRRAEKACQWRRMKASVVQKIKAFIRIDLSGGKIIDNAITGDK